MPHWLLWLIEHLGYHHPNYGCVIHNHIITCTINTHH